MSNGSANEACEHHGDAPAVVIQRRAVESFAAASLHQFTTTLIGVALVSSNVELMRKRCPSAVTGGSEYRRRRGGGQPEGYVRTFGSA